MLPTLLPIGLAGIIFTIRIAAQCSDPSFLLCSAPSSNDSSSDDDSSDDSSDDDSGSGSSSSDNTVTDPTSFDWASLQSVASLPIGKRSLVPRQDDSDITVCCNPDVDCLAIGDIPFCYDEATTEFLFPDGSYGYISNSTYYATDGTFVDFGDGTYSSTDGSTGTFAAATATADGGLASATAKISVKAVASDTASAPRQPLATGAEKDKVGSASAGSASVTSTPTTGSTPVAKPTGSGSGEGTQSTKPAQTGGGTKGIVGGMAGWLSGLFVAVSVGALWLL